MTKARKLLYGGLIGLTAALLVLGVFFDKTIADLMYQPENVMAKIFESVGIFPPFVFVSSMFTVFYFSVKQEDKNAVLKKVLCIAATALSYLLFGFMATEQLFASTLPRLLIGLGTAVLLTPVTVLVFRGKSPDTLKRLSIFLIFASMVAVISSLISINVLKYIWGRPRYREMIAEGDYLLQAFTPWYKINGFTLHGHHSFPSGHTCSATNLLVLCALGEVFPDADRKKGTVAVVVAIYIFAMAYSRMVLGAHFLSDVTGGFFIGFLTYAVARYVYFDKSRIGVEAIMQANNPVKEVADEPATETENQADEAKEDQVSLADESVPVIETDKGETKQGEQA